MSDSTTQLDNISSSQAQKEVSANALFDAMSPAAIFGRRASTSAALTWGYYGGDLWVDGVLTTVANGTVALSASTTNYVEATRAGVVSKNTTGFTAGQIPLYTIITSASSVTSYTDHRITNTPVYGRISKSVAGSSNVTLTAAESRSDSLEFTGALTGNINVIVPTVARKWQIRNNTTGSFTLTVKTSAGTGIAITQGNSISLECDGTNIIKTDDSAGGGGGGGVEAVSVSFSYGDATPVPIYTAGANKVVYSVEVVIVVPFDGVGATITVGDAAVPDRLMHADENALMLIGSNTTAPAYKYGVDTPLTLSISPGAGASQGSGMVVIRIQT